MVEKAQNFIFGNLSGTVENEPNFFLKISFESEDFISRSYWIYVVLLKLLTKNLIYLIPSNRCRSWSNIGNHVSNFYRCL